MPELRVAGQIQAKFRPWLRKASKLSQRCTDVAAARCEVGHGARRPFQQLNVGFMLTRDMRVFQEQHAAALALQDQFGDLRIASERPAAKRPHPVP